jgi:hypothetical protein
MVDANRPAMAFSANVAPELLTPPVNALRMSLHPKGMAPQIVNLAEWRTVILRRLAHEIDVTRDPVLVDLHRELMSYGAQLKTKGVNTEADDSIGGSVPLLVPMQLRTPHGVLSFWSTTTVFGSAMDTTIAELAIETFLPADEQTRFALQAMAAATPAATPLSS